MYSSVGLLFLLYILETHFNIYIALGAKKTIYMKFLTEKEYISKMHFLVGYLETET